MGGNSGGGGSGGRSGGGGGGGSTTEGGPAKDVQQPGEVFRAAELMKEQQKPKVLKVLVQNGKPAPGTKAAEYAARKQRVEKYSRKLKLDRISDDYGMFGHLKKI